MAEPLPRVALASMPWASVWVPSIQLAVLRQCLHGIAKTETFETYVDFAARISPRLYKPISESLGFAEEWVFAANYFPGEGVEIPKEPYGLFPPIGISTRDKEQALLSALSDVAADYLDELASEDWARFDLIAFSLTISQTAASMALAQRIRARHPDLPIVFGGSSCAGPSAEAILKICPHVDVVVHGEAEACFAQLVKCLTRGLPVTEIPGIAYRVGDGSVFNRSNALNHFHRPAALPNYDDYFHRLAGFGLDNSPHITVPFESSRGCWWGEKAQCIFCGLHETMKWRERPADEVIAELDHLSRRHGINKFFATDLIMPKSYYRDFLPKLIESGRDYEFYYELKADVTRKQMTDLRRAGVNLIQPGIESLSTAVLKLIRKGTTAVQNIALLKWAQELGIEVSWNIIVGTPGEDPNVNDEMAAQCPWLHHLPPPFIVEFELTRFSPSFRTPGAFGISKVEPVALYKSVFPVSDEILSDLVYRFEYESSSFNGRPQWMIPGAPPYAAALNEAVDVWHAAHTGGASLEFVADASGGARIVDRRASVREAHEFVLNADEEALYRWIDAPASSTHVAAQFENAHARAAARLGGQSGINELLDTWAGHGLLFREAARIVGLAPGAPRVEGISPDRQKTTEQSGA